MAQRREEAIKAANERWINQPSEPVKKKKAKALSIRATPTKGRLHERF